jgi:hypothetical protein
MRTSDGARPFALGLLAAVAGCAALGIAVLAAAGAHVCHHHVAVAHVHALATGMHGAMTMPAAEADEAAEGLCPVLVYAAAVAAGLCLLALVGLIGMRATLPAALAAAAGMVAAQRLAPLTAALGLAGAVPLAAILALDGGLAGLPALAAVAALVAGAFLSALALAGAARLVLTLARRLVVALIAVLRLLAPGAERPWFDLRRPVLAAAGGRFARRRPSRAPPVLR